MSFNETYFEFDAELDRLETEIESVRDELAALDADAPNQARRQLADRLQSLQSQRKGVVWAAEPAYESDDFPQWDEDVDGVTLAAIRAGTFGRLMDDLESSPDAGGGTSTNLVIAEGTVEDPEEGEAAPYVTGNQTQTAAAVGQLHPYYRQWAEARINDLLDPESGNATTSETSPAETSTKPTSTPE